MENEFIHGLFVVAVAVVVVAAAIVDELVVLSLIDVVFEIMFEGKTGELLVL